MAKKIISRQPEMRSVSPFALSMNEASKPSYKWRRVLLKVSGEALAGDHSQNIDPKVGMQKISISFHSDRKITEE